MTETKIISAADPAAIQQAMDAREDFDITVDAAKPIEGYRKVVKASEQ